MAKNNKNSTNNNPNPNPNPVDVNTKIVGKEQITKKSKFKKAARTAWTVTKVTVSTVVLGTAAALSAAVLYGVAEELDKRAEFEKNEHEYYYEKVGFRTRYFNKNGRDVTSDVKAALKSGTLKKEDIGGKEV